MTRGTDMTWEFRAFGQTPPAPASPPAPGAPGPAPGAPTTPGPTLYRLPAYGQFAGTDQVYPVQYLPKDYAFYLPYVVGFSRVQLAPSASVTLTYNQPSDSDFLILRQYSYTPSNRQYSTGFGGAVVAVVRIPNVAEITSQPVNLDILFPDQSMPPWVWEIPLILSAGDALEIVLVNNDATNSYVINLALSGIRAYL